MKNKPQFVLFVVTHTHTHTHTHKRDGYVLEGPAQVEFCAIWIWVCVGKYGQLNMYVQGNPAEIQIPRWNLIRPQFDIRTTCITY